MHWFNCEVKYSAHEVLLILLIGARRIILFTEIAEIVKPNKFLAGALNSIYVHLSLAEEVLVFPRYAREASVKVLRNLCAGKHADIRWKAMVEHLAVVLILHLSHPERTDVSHCINSFVSPPAPRILRLSYVLNKASLLQGLEYLMFHCVLSVLLDN